jgi:hypothetical protein
MKKLLIASVSVLALSTGAAFADNSSGVEQNGTSLTVGVDQLSGSGANKSTIYQGIYGNNNPAANSSASVTQIGGPGVTDSYIQQNDRDHSATVKQTASAGGNQTSQITQSNVGNYANVTQETPGAEAKQESYVTQSGQYGAVTINQSGPSDFSDVKQAGLDNNANSWGFTSSGVLVYGGVNVTQGGGSANTSNVTQESDRSGVAVTQNAGSGVTNISGVTQHLGGALNFASINQH